MSVQSGPRGPPRYVETQDERNKKMNGRTPSELRDGTEPPGPASYTARSSLSPFWRARYDDERYGKDSSSILVCDVTTTLSADIASAVITVVNYKAR